ncbi:MAG: DEAD/DEAH box helicase [Candidatus Heimdallarchaeota archaeon]|nr:DEAD/DEAH box helicase [Candidatus Heimdallarchaeota archaeon]
MAKVVHEITQSNHPFNHQVEAIKHLVENNTEKGRDLIINGGTYSGKSLSFTLPGIIKLLTGELDFFVIFYPSKQLLLDQFDRMKELVTSLEKKTGIRLTVKKYSGDITKKSNSSSWNVSKHNELFETEQKPPTILLATFDKIWYQLISGQQHLLLEKIKACKYLVFDEIHAFEGFAAAIIKGFVQIHKKSNPNSQVVLSSATIDNVTGFRDDFLPEAAIITCPPVRGEQEFLGTTKEQAVALLAELWEGLDSLPGKICLVFLDSKEEIELLTEKLCAKLSQDHPFFDSDTVAMIHADLPYVKRKKVLDEIRTEQQNKIRILLSSSVLELGVNVPNIQTVVNIGIPITQKDGIVQRMARNRSKPGERRVNIFLFDLANPRDLFYWEHLEIIRTILKTNACNPILYPKNNPKILAALFILHLRYGISDFEQIMSFFLKSGIQTHELARQQYTKLVCFKVLKKEHGKVLFTTEGEDIVIQQLRKNNILIPFSIRAINKDWMIELHEGVNTSYFNESMKQLGKISSRDVLRKGLPGNIITRNKQHYLVTAIDHQQKTVQVKRFLTESKKEVNPVIPVNRLYEPMITVGVFPKKLPGKEQSILFGQLTLTRKVKTIANAALERALSRSNEQDQNNLFFWQELSEKESIELALIEQVEGISITSNVSLQKVKSLSQKQALKLFGEILLLETEMVLSIPAAEFGLVCNDNQLAIYDKGEANGNTEYLYQHLQRVAAQGLKRLQNCPCERGCKQCYGEILGLLPEGVKGNLIELMKGIGEENNGLDFENDIEKQITIQENYQEEKIIAISDIHLTSEFCYEEELYQAVSTLSKQADIIIINGDLLDRPSEAGKEAFGRLQELAVGEGFWSKLVFIRSSSIHDANIEHSANALYLDYALVETSVGEVLFVHGNKIGLDPGELKITTAEQAAIEAKNKLIQTGRSWLPRITKETHLVIGHLHKRFYNERWRVYGLGHWTNKGDKFHQKSFLTINSMKNNDMISLSKYKEEKL